MKELIEGGYIGQAVVALLIWVSIAYLAVTGQPIPDLLADAGFVVLGFYFQQAVNRAIYARNNGKIER